MESLPTSTTAPRQSNFFEVCSKCKTGYDCCHGTRPPITEARRKTIEQYLKRHGISIANAFAEEDYVFPREGLEGYCVFHDMKTRRCVIHEVKPETCVAGPVTFDVNRQTGRVEYFIKRETICPLAKVVYEDKNVLAKHLKSAKKEITRLVDELDPEALKAILKKDEPETFRLADNDT